MIAPAARSFFTVKASSGGMEPFSSKEPAVVGMSYVSKLSFSTTGTPCSGDRGPFALRSRSSAFASADMTPSGSTDVRSTNRYMRGPTERARNIGFRLVADFP